MWRAALVVAAVAALLGESVEVWRLARGGMALPGLPFRVTLAAGYGILALGAGLALGAVVREPRRRAWLLATMAGALVVVPWANFALFPGLTDPRTIAGTALCLVGVAAVARLCVAWPAAATAGVVALALAANLGLGTGAGSGGEVGRAPLPRAATAPNVVLVLIDTLRADHLGTYGYARPTSPRIDALADASTVFRGVVAQAPWTKPSVAAMLTGMYVHEHGAIGTRDALDTRHPTLAELMQRAGYRTAAFTANPWITAEFGFERGFAHFDGVQPMGMQLTNLHRLLKRGERGLRRLGLDLAPSRLLRLAEPPNPKNAVRDRALVDRIVAWLADAPAAPFFLYVHLIGPHDPYEPPPEYAAPFRRGLSTPPLARPPARVQTVFETAEPLEPEALASLVAEYDGAVRFSDAQVGRILDALAAAGLDDETVVLITSDHGEEFYEHGNWRHGNQLYQEVVDVPLIVHLPGVAPARRGGPAMLVDVPATVLGLAGVPLPDGVALRGRDLFAEAPAERPVFAEHWWFEGREYVSRMVRRGADKLIESRDESAGQARVEHYDLALDPGEQYPLPERAAGGAALQTLLARFAEGAPAVSERSVEIDPATRKQLEMLGYLEGNGG